MWREKGDSCVGNCVCVPNLSQWGGGKMKGECCFQFPPHAEIST